MLVGVLVLNDPFARRRTAEKDVAAAVGGYEYSNSTNQTRDGTPDLAGGAGAAGAGAAGSGAGGSYSAAAGQTWGRSAVLSTHGEGGASSSGGDGGRVGGGGYGGGGGGGEVGGGAYGGLTVESDLTLEESEPSPRPPVTKKTWGRSSLGTPAAQVPVTAAKVPVPVAEHMGGAAAGTAGGALRTITRPSLNPRAQSPPPPIYKHPSSL